MSRTIALFVAGTAVCCLLGVALAGALGGLGAGMVWNVAWLVGRWRMATDGFSA